MALPETTSAMSAFLRSLAYHSSFTSAQDWTTASAPISISDHVRTQSWDWPDAANALDFVVETPEPAHVDALNVVVNVSGSIHQSELPEELQGLPTYTVRLAGDTPPHANIIESRATLDHFRSACYDLFAAIELSHKQAAKFTS